MTESGSILMIEASGLSKFYGDFAAIRDVSFSIPQGQVAAFLGPNGAGKSTTMKILTGYLAPSAGTARIAGLDVNGSRIAAAERLGYLPENQDRLLPARQQGRLQRLVHDDVRRQGQRRLVRR